jgi:NAD(P)-dependent dehydrogenase (short-subunit alcohol dehydrogenase family)
MDLGLKNKVVFIAGASRGIGLGIAEACLAEGAKVALTARGAEALEATRARLAAAHGQDRVWVRADDMRETAVIEAALDEAEARSARSGARWPMSACIPRRLASRSTTRTGMTPSPRTWTRPSASAARPLGD